MSPDSIVLSLGVDNPNDESVDNRLSNQDTNRSVINPKAIDLPNSDCQDGENQQEGHQSLSSSSSCLLTNEDEKKTLDIEKLEKVR